MSIKGPSGYVSIPCGKCHACLSNKRKSWAFRIAQELKHSETALFLTFTYDDDHVIYGEFKPTLFKRDMQLFLKRLRKYITDKKIMSQRAQKPPQIKYFIVGEYGSETERPHYHGLLFNIPLQVHPFITDIWQKGFVHFGNVEEASTLYTMKYIVQPEDQMQGVEKQFSLISKGIGSSYLSNAMIKYHKKGLKAFVVNNGYKQAMPRYYREKLFTHLEKVRINEISKTVFVQAASKDLARIEANYPSYGEYELNAKEAQREAFNKTIKHNQRL